MMMMIATVMSSKSMRCVQMSSGVNNVNVECDCRDLDSVYTFKWSMLGNLSVTGLYLSRCHQLYLDLSPPLPAPPPQVTIINTEYLSINISSTSPHLNITS